MPLGLTVTPDSGWLDRGNHFGLYAVGRLKPGVTVTQAHGEGERIAAHLKRLYFDSNSTNSARVLLLRDRIVEQIADTLLVLMWAVGFLLLLACVNVANLLVASGASREHEFAIRTALGGTRWRLVRQLLAESALLSAAGGVLGVVLAYWLLKMLIALAPTNLPRIEEVALSRMSLLFAIAAAGACGLLFGAFPAIQASGPGRLHLLARASRTTAVSPHRTRRALMVVEVALALVLLAGCGLMARTMMRLNAVEPGFQAERLLTARVTLGGEAWTTERRLTFYDGLLEKLNTTPGVSRASLVLSLPIEGSRVGLHLHRRRQAGAAPVRSFRARRSCLPAPATSRRWGFGSCGDGPSIRGTRPPARGSR